MNIATISALMKLICRFEPEGGEGAGMVQSGYLFENMAVRIEER